MIQTENFFWLPAEAAHRTKKLEILAFLGSQDRTKLPNFDDYHRSVANHLAMAGRVFELQFGFANYRRASGSPVEVSSELRAYASATADDLAGKTTVSVGLLYALEDFWQCVVSDDNTDLSLYGGVPAGTNNNVARDADDFHAHDRTRFFDYSCLAGIETAAARASREIASPLGPEYADVLTAAIASSAWSSATSKMLSVDPRRVRLADFMADVSLHWILAHEDAHIYCGHTARFSKLGVAASELTDADNEFLTLARLRSREPIDGHPYALVRTLCELHADANACLRLVDSFFDRDTFLVYPLLRRGVATLLEYAASEGLELSEKEANLLVIARVCISAAIGAVLLFQRHIEKKDIDSDEYPDIGVRLANIVIATAMRIDARLHIPTDHSPHYFAWPAAKASMLLRLGISKDIEVMTWNLLANPALLQDPDLPPGKNLRLTQHLTTITERSRQLKLIFESFYYVETLAQERLMLPDLAALLAMTDTALAVALHEAQYYEVFSEVFKASQYTAFPTLSAKLDDSYQRIQRQSHDLGIACKLASAIRARRQ